MGDHPPPRTPGNGDRSWCFGHGETEKGLAGSLCVPGVNMSGSGLWGDVERLPGLVLGSSVQ